MKHVGSWVSEDGRHDVDTDTTIQAAYGAIRRLAKAWGIGSDRGRGENSGLRKTVRLETLKKKQIQQFKQQLKKLLKSLLF